MIPANKQLSSAVIWGFLQLVILGIGASEFPLWAHHPLPRESLALPVLLIGQTILLALFASGIAPTIQSLMISLLMMAPVDELAGILSNSSQAIIMKGFVAVAVWMIGLAGACWFVGEPPKQLVVMALASLLTAGGVILDYLRWEACALRGQTGEFYPITLLPKLGDAAAGVAEVPWLQISLPALLAIALAAAIRITAARRNLPSTLLHSNRKES